MIGCSCYECGIEVDANVRNHFVSIEGKILCGKCSLNFEECTKDTKELLISYQETGKINKTLKYISDRQKLK